MNEDIQVVYFSGVGMKEESGEPRSPRQRSRSPIDRARSPEQSREETKQEKTEVDKEALDSYSASLRLASLEHLTGKPPVSVAGFGFPFGPGLPAPAASTSASKVPTDSASAPSLQDALLNLQKTASASSFPTPPANLLANPLASLLASQGAAGLSGLPKPADLIQQAQTLQLLAHLQTMLMNPGAGQPSAPSTGLPGSLNNAANFQKVCFIHIYEEAQNKWRFN